MSKSENTVPADDVIDIVDPLGEIRACAKEKWKDAGEPADKTWKDFWEEAERLVVGPPKDEN